MLRAVVRTPALQRRRFTSIAVERAAQHITVPALCASFPFLWLRDVCPCPACVHPSTRQKRIRTSDFVHAGLEPVKAEAVDGGLRVVWATANKDKEKHESFYPASFLERHASLTALSAFHKDVAPLPWGTASTLSTHLQLDALPDPVPYASLASPTVLARVYTRLLRSGLVFLSGVPTLRTTDADCELRVLARHLGALRRTFYGETWDVRTVRESRNIAYTNLDLGFHMDLLCVPSSFVLKCFIIIQLNCRYFKEPPRFQILHALRNRVRGGHSLFIDALHAAHALRAASPASFSLLARTPIPFHYINDGHHLHHAHPTFKLAPHSGEEEPQIESINYSPPFQAPLPPNTPTALYEALASFAAHLDAPEARLTRLLGEGDAVVFDNRRILHARAAFEEIQDSEKGEGEPSRWLKGCYLEEDALLDRMRVLRAELELQKSN